MKLRYMCVCSPQMTQKTESSKEKECVCLGENSSDSLPQHAVSHTNLSSRVTLETWLLPRQCGADMVYQSCSLYTSLTISSLPPSPSALPCLSTELNARLLSHSLLTGLWDWSQYWFWLCCTHPSSPEMLDWRAHCFLTSLFPCKMGNCLSGAGSGYWSHDAICILLSVHASDASTTCITICIRVNLLKTH